ncbi:MAG: hypothetical protein PHQ96_04870 [Candidatus Omnitrophica bacterium]|nr:hypothetical protein [Candidatus Omnitrophota bacterium]
MKKNNNGVVGVRINPAYQGINQDGPPADTTNDIKNISKGKDKILKHKHFVPLWFAFLSIIGIGYLYKL